MTKYFCSFHWHEYREMTTDIQFVQSVVSIGQQRMQVLSLNKVMVCLTVVNLVKSNSFTSHFEYFFPSLTPREFNSYGARRGNDAVMTRGTFASIKLQNRFIGKPGPKTLHIPSGQTVSGSEVVTFELKHAWLVTRPPIVRLISWMSSRQLSAIREMVFPSSSWPGKTTALGTPGTGSLKDHTCW